MDTTPPAPTTSVVATQTPAPASSSVGTQCDIPSFGEMIKFLPVHKSVKQRQQDWYDHTSLEDITGLKDKDGYLCKFEIGLPFPVLKKHLARSGIVHYACKDAQCPSGPSTSCTSEPATCYASTPVSWTPTWN